MKKEKNFKDIKDVDITFDDEDNEIDDEEVEKYYGEKK
jgi:hypothetical protein